MEIRVKFEKNQKGFATYDKKRYIKSRYKYYRKKLSHFWQKKKPKISLKLF